MRFWLGTHQTGWLAAVDVPLFLSAVRLRKRKRLPRARGEWALDSGGFSAIRQDGCYRVGPRQYVEEVKRWRDEIGNLVWCAIQDWMCEPDMLARTGKTVAEHQELTVQSWLDLTALDAALPWVPVLQGYTLEDYHRCADLYEKHAATDLASLPLVGVGSVCRRQGTREAAAIIKSLHARGLHNLHGFGMKTLALTGKRSLAGYLKSSDSMAWSHRARNAWRHEKRRLCRGEHTGGCGNCQPWALAWRERLVRAVERSEERGTQLLLF